MSYRKFISLFVLIVLTTSGLVGLSMDKVDATPPGAQERIIIVGDSQFAQWASWEGWPGNGTESDPYVIEGYAIDAGGDGSCISISDTTVHFVIKDGIMTNASALGADPGCGVLLNNVTNGDIVNVTCHSCDLGGIFVNRSSSIWVMESQCSGNKEYGVLMIGSSDCLVSGSDCSFTGIGVYLFESENCTIEGNTCSHNQDNGIYLESSSRNTVVGNDASDNEVNIDMLFADENLIGNNTMDDGIGGISLKNSISNHLIGNEMTGCSIALMGNSPGLEVESYTSQTIEDCTVNGLPVLYIVNQDYGNATLPSGAGQVILGNVTNMKISSQEITGVTIGMIIAYSSFVHLNDCAITDSPIGVQIISSSGCTVDNCDFLGLKYGLEIYYSQGCKVTNSNCSGNQVAGIYIEGGQDFEIRNNICLENQYGIYLYHGARDGIIAQNECSGNDEFGIYIYGSPDNLVEGNECLGNKMMGISLFPYSNACTVIGNRILGNVGYSFYALQCDDLVFRNNTAAESEYGIYLYSSSGAEMANNTIWDCAEGIHLFRSAGDLIKGNNMTGCSMFLDGDGPEHFITHNFTDNWANGLPIAYIANQEMHQQTFTSEVGQLILANVTGLRVESLTIRNGTAGIVMGYCDDTWVIDGRLNRNVYGAVMEGCKASGIFLSDLSHNGIGLMMDGVNDSGVIASLFIQNDGYAIKVDDSCRNEFWANAFLGNNGATAIFDSDHIQSFDKSINNNWTRLGWGNHWSDWSYPDMNGDGIVDVPYPINNQTGLKDEAPLSGMVGPPAFPRIKAIDDSFVQLEWEPANYSLWAPLDHYAIYRQNGTAEPVLITTLEPSNFTYYDTSVESLHEYTYYILSVSEMDSSAMDWPLEVFVPSEDTCLLSGVVKDSLGTPMQGARVAVETGVYQNTDEQGRFTLEVEKGHRILSVIKQGYETEIMEIEVEGSRMDLDTIWLQEAHPDDGFPLLALLGSTAGLMVLALLLTWARGRE
jgi:parallel beta-helix repeat protein